MFTIIRHECYRLLDRHREAPVPLGAVEDGLFAGAPDADATLAGRRRAELLAMALRDLDPVHREVVLLRDIEELSAPEAAARLGISIDALKSRLHRARVRLREHVFADADLRLTVRALSRSRPQNSHHGRLHRELHRLELVPERSGLVDARHMIG